jgi:hypothetical protein
MLHLGCHGKVIGSAPGQSHLLLADGQELRVDAILRQAKDRPPNAPGGLVSLAACSSDLAAAEYDEALTRWRHLAPHVHVSFAHDKKWQFPQGCTKVGADVDAEFKS